jgi:uncharacterized protein YrzB (UPF0473 family)
MSTAVKTVEIIRNIHGEYLVLFDEQGQEIEYTLLQEIDLDGKVYAYLKQTDVKDDDDIEVFRASLTPDGSYELETIEDDEEWETVAEIFDEMFYGEEDK